MMGISTVTAAILTLYGLVQHQCLARPEQLLRTQRDGDINHSTSTMDIRMPEVRPNKDDQYLCYGRSIGSDPLYIVNFEALADASRTHHLLVYACHQPQKQSSGAWPCSSICARGETPKILYAWAKNAQPTHMPPNVGFEVGGETGLETIVLQMHYSTAMADGEPSDRSGVRLTVTSERQRYIAGIYIFMRYTLNIPAQTPVVHGDVSCTYQGPTKLYPFAFRVHAHSLGRVISAYHYNDSWYLIGKGNPQWPQAFYPVDGYHEISPGDNMFARCTYDSTDRSTSTKIGGKHTDEMCNFYMMYYTDAAQGETYIQCVNDNLPREETASIPADSDVPLPPNPALEEMAHDHLYHPAVEMVQDWPQINAGDHVNLGQISGVATDSEGNVHIFHRGSTVWDSQSFAVNNYRHTGPNDAIPEKTLITLDADGHVVKQWGSDMFYMPHGLHIDHSGNFWLTDVAMHQVFKFAPGETNPAMTLGVRFEPGSDQHHFCKPTDVAVLSTGEFFVADGYCNHRILKFAANGTFLKEWGTRTSEMGGDGFPPPSAFDIPHSITALEDKEQVCVADRENGRIQCFQYDGTFSHQIHPQQFNRRLFAVNYCEPQNLLFAVNGPDISDSSSVVQGFVLDADQDLILETFGAPGMGGTKRFSNPHDVAANADCSAVYVAEIGPNQVWKFTVHPETLRDSSHLTVKKSGVGHLRPSSVDSETGSGAETRLSTSMTGDFGVSVVIGLLLVIPILIIVAVTVVMRLKKNGKLKFLSYSKYHNRRFNLGDFFGSHKGFDRLSTEDGDELEHLNSDSDVEEYSATTRKA